MKMLKIAFWGLGSIARRHIVNLSEILEERHEIYQIDIIRHSNNELPHDIEKVVKNVYLENQLKDKKYDIIFITNPTSLHYETIKKCVKYAKHLFIEKPVFDRCDIDVSSLELNEDSVYYVACPLRYTSVLQYVKNKVDLSQVFSVRAISSSYLPDWRPGIDYRETYSARKDLGGGVSIDLIHEWDYLTALFGLPEQVIYVGGTYSKLEINSEDLAVYIGMYPDKIVELHLDYFGRKVVREMMLFTADDTIVVDIANSKVIYQKRNEVIDLSEERNCFQKRELIHFLDIIQKKNENDNSIENALKILKIAKNYKES